MLDLYCKIWCTMPEVIIKYKSNKTLQALLDIAKYFDFTVEAKATPNKDKGTLPIVFAEKPDITALAGIWKGRDITIEQLRKNAWGDRL